MGCCHQEEKEEIEIGDATTRIAVMNCDWDKLKVTGYWKLNIP